MTGDLQDWLDWAAYHPTYSVPTYTPTQGAWSKPRSVDELLAELFRCNDSEYGLIWDAMFFWP